MPTSGNPQDRQMDEGAQARTGNNSVAQNTSNDPCEIVQLRIGYIDHIFNIRRLSPEQVKSRLHGLWSLVIQTAIDIPADDPAQDRLRAEVVNAQYLQSPYDNSETADGVLWRDLPFLGNHVYGEWSANLMDFEKDHRLNLAAFTAKLVEADVPGPELGYCALHVLRETLETRRGLTVTEDGRDTPIVDLLPAAVAWFKFAGLTFLKFSLHTEGIKPVRNPPTLGTLAQEDGILAPGYSRERWHFWERRLEQLSKVDDKEVKEQALKGMKAMQEAMHEARKEGYVI